MQAQINPHLLYNTISGINYLISGREYEAASGLCHLALTTASFKPKPLAVAEDIELAADYLFIQQRIHPGLFEFTIDIDPALLSSPIPKLTLQPVLENSILHGFMGCGCGKAGNWLPDQKAQRRSLFLIMAGDFRR